MNHPARLALFLGILLFVPAAVLATTAVSASASNEPARLSSQTAPAIQAPPPPVSFTLTINKSGSGSGTVTPPSGTQYLSGTTATLNAAAAAGSVFSGWTGAVTGITNPLTIHMVADTSVTANFTLIPQRSLTTNVVGTGSVAPSGTTQYAQGTVVQLTATAASGWQFTSWSGGGLSGSANPINITMDADKVVTATFEQLFNLTVSVSGSGSVTKNPNQSQYLSGSSVQLTASPASGWQFNGWSGDLGGTANPGSILMSANRVVVAVFSLVPTSAAPTSTSQPAATSTPIPLATITPLLGVAVTAPTATSTPTSGSTLPTTGGSPLTFVAVGLALVMIIIGSRYLRQSSA